MPGKISKIKARLKKSLAKRKPKLLKNLEEFIVDPFELYMMRLTQVRLELTNACNYSCKICPRKKMTRQIGVMSADDLRQILANIRAYRPSYNGEVHMHGFGEPLLDPDFISKVQIVRSTLPKAKILIATTLGEEKPKSFFGDAFEAGLNEVHVSCYGYDSQSYKAIHGVDRFNLVKANLEMISGLKNRYRPQLQLKGPARADDEGNKAFEGWIKKLGYEYHCLQIHNHGSMGFNASCVPLKPCRVFNGSHSHYLQISWNLNVIPCSFVSDDEIVWGNLKTQPLRRIILSEERQNFLDAHNRMSYENYELCSTCMLDPSTHH